MSPKPPIYTVTAPSGTGKTTLNRRLAREYSNIEISISYTTRKQRRDEINGDHYWFVSKDEFNKQIKNGQMLEWALVFENYYGTSLKDLDRIAKKKHTALLEIDVQGWLQAKEKLKDSKSIFILPPSISELWNRLNTRASDSPENRMTRLQTAKEELMYVKEYDYFILNENLDSAFDELKKAFFDPNKLSLTKEEGLKHAKKLVLEFDKAQWITKLKKKLSL